MNIIERTAAEFTSDNIILSYEQIGRETDTNKMKHGDGETAWIDLDYSGLLLIQNHFEVDKTSCLFKQNINIVHTGTTTETILYSSENLRNLVKSNDIIRFLFLIAANNSGHTKSLKFYVGPNSANLTGAAQLGVYTITTNRAMQTGVVRNMRFMNSLASQQIASPTTDGIADDEDVVSSNAAIGAITHDFSTDTYIHITGTLSNTAASLTLRHSRGELLR